MLNVAYQNAYPWGRSDLFLNWQKKEMKQLKEFSLLRCIEESFGFVVHQMDVLLYKNSRQFIQKLISKWLFVVNFHFSSSQNQPTIVSRGKHPSFSLLTQASAPPKTDVLLGENGMISTTNRRFSTSPKPPYRCQPTPGHATTACYSSDRLLENRWLCFLEYCMWCWLVMKS